MIFICFDLFWFDSNLWRNCFIELSSELSTPVLDRFQIFFTSVKNWCPQLTWKLNEVISPKIWIKSKQMKTNDFSYCFTSKAYSAVILSINFHLYLHKLPKQPTWKYHILLKIENFWVRCLGTLSWYKWKFILSIAAE